MAPSSSRTWSKQVAASARATVASARARAASGRLLRPPAATEVPTSATPAVLAGVVRGGDPWQPPWYSLPRDLVERLEPVIPDLVETIIRVVPDQVPAYAGARDGVHGRALRLGVTGAFGQLLRLPGTSLPALEPDMRELMGELGAAEFREGRSMDALLGAYRTAARIAFRELSAECVRQRMDMQVVVDLGESIWAYIDELSSVSAQAYAAEQTARAGLLELHRTQFAAALLDGDRPEPELRRLASLAGLALPRSYDVVVVPAAYAEAIREGLGTRGVFVEREDAVVALLTGEGERTRRERLTRMLRDIPAVVGPVVGWEDVPHAFATARSLLAPAAPPDTIFAEDHLARVVLAAQPRVLEQLRARVLAPLDGLSDAKREVMEQTLLAWLRHWGKRAEIAEHLGVHPQTVGYRVRRLRELFGNALEDPETRFAVEMVLLAGSTPSK